MATKVQRKPIQRKKATIAPPGRGTPASSTQGDAAATEQASPSVRHGQDKLSVRISAGVHGKVQTHRKRSNQSNTEILTEAFRTVGSNYRHLTGATNAAHQGPPPRTTPTKRQRRGTTKDLTIYYDAAQQEWLDEQVTNGGAPSRTQLIETVLDKYLA